MIKKVQKKHIWVGKVDRCTIKRQPWLVQLEESIQKHATSSCATCRFEVLARSASPLQLSLCRDRPLPYPIPKPSISLSSSGYSLSIALTVCTQEKFRPGISHFNEIVPVAARLVAAAKELEIPVLVTEQYPKKLGASVPELQLAKVKATNLVVAPKSKFSMLIPEIETAMVPGSVVLFGIEAHVCVQQTALDLLERGVDVHVVADATSSRTQADRMFAFERMRNAGAFITTHEAVLFELMRDATHPNFKALSGLIRQVLPGSNLV